MWLGSYADAGPSLQLSSSFLVLPCLSMIEQASNGRIPTPAVLDVAGFLSSSFLLHVVKRPKNQFPFLESRLLEEVQSEWNCGYLTAKWAFWSNMTKHEPNSTVWRGVDIFFYFTPNQWKLTSLLFGNTGKKTKWILSPVPGLSDFYNFNYIQ